MQPWRITEVAYMMVALMLSMELAEWNTWATVLWESLCRTSTLPRSNLSQGKEAWIMDSRRTIQLCVAQSTLTQESNQEVEPIIEQLTLRLLMILSITISRGTWPHRRLPSTSRTRFTLSTWTSLRCQLRRNRKTKKLKKDWKMKGAK